MIFPDILGAGRFAKIGIRYPEVMGPFVGTVEIVCGALIIVRLLTRLAAIPLIIVMLVAIVSTKVPILLGHGFGPFTLPDLKRYGFWSAQHQARADLTMLLGCLYLFVVGSGRWSIDRMLDRDATRADHQP
jgi:putative oxidoreductase